MSVVTFHDADDPGANDAFKRWRREHPAGFVLNHGSPSDMVLHTTDCPHFIFKEPRSLTSYKKVCSTSIVDLKTWAADHGGVARICRTCSP
jgi:hypothetical protein